MNWNIFYAFTIALLTGVGAGLAGNLAATKTWHKWVFWGGGSITLVLIYFQARATERQAQDNVNKEVRLQ